MDQPGLHIALEPARTLFEPRRETCRRFFEGCGVEHRDAHTSLCQTYSEIRIFGDVIGIPSPHFLQRRGSEVIGCSAERHGYSQRLERWKQRIEPQRIVEREETRQRYYGANATRKNPLRHLNSVDE